MPLPAAARRAGRGPGDDDPGGPRPAGDRLRRRLHDQRGPGRGDEPAHRRHRHATAAPGKRCFAGNGQAIRVGDPRRELDDPDTSIRIAPSFLALRSAWRLQAHLLACLEEGAQALGRPNELAWITDVENTARVAETLHGFSRSRKPNHVRARFYLTRPITQPERKPSG